jgi:hypothetical protein
MSGQGDGAVPDRETLRRHLVETRIAGDVATTRQNNLRNAGRMADRRPGYTFGLEVDREWSHADVVAVMAERVGIDPDLSYAFGQDTIDPDLCLDALDRMAARLAEVARQRLDVLVATGHPTGLLPVHAGIAAALRAAGCRIVTPGDGLAVEVDEQERRVCYVDDVAMLASSIDLLHTHSPVPMRAVLAAAGTPPGFVVADHGWAGAAAQAGIPTVGFADCNDPALFVGEAEGKVEVTVPLDDNVAPAFYTPVTAYLVAGITV